MNIYKIISAENIKTRKNLMFISLCVFPFIVNLSLAIIYSVNKVPNSNFWIHSLQHTHLFFMVIYPTLIALVAYVYVNMESSNNCNRQLFCMPEPPYKIYLSKCFVLFYYFTLSLIIAYVSYILSIYILKTSIPEIEELVITYDCRNVVDLLFLKTYIILLPVVFFQFALSLASKNIWLPLTTSLFLTVAGVIIAYKEYYYFMPHASINVVFEEFGMNTISIFDNVFYVTISYTILFVIAGYFAFKSSK